VATSLVASLINCVKLNSRGTWVREKEVEERVRRSTLRSPRTTHELFKAENFSKRFRKAGRNSPSFMLGGLLRKMTTIGSALEKRLKQITSHSFGNQIGTKFIGGVD